MANEIGPIICTGGTPLITWHDGQGNVYRPGTEDWVAESAATWGQVAVTFARSTPLGYYSDAPAGILASVAQVQWIAWDWTATGLNQASALGLESGVLYGPLTANDARLPAGAIASAVDVTSARDAVIDAMPVAPDNAGIAAIRSKTDLLSVDDQGRVTTANPAEDTSRVEVGLDGKEIVIQ